MMIMDFQRYLAAKETVDDRALNKDVWRTLHRQVAQVRNRPLQVLEVGAGTGVMARRLWRWRLHPHIHYTGVDLLPENITQARTQMAQWARRQTDISVLTTRNSLILNRPGQQMTVSFMAEDALHFVADPAQTGCWDVLIAHAFLDLLDVSSALPDLLSVLRPGGLCYFTLNFDGVTLFEPVADEALESHLLALYHRSMDERIVDGRVSGDSRAGRHLFGQLQAAGAEALAAGASDWVVIPHQGAYPADEAYFLHFIIHTVYQELSGHPDVDGAALDAWAAQRHAQIDAGELLYIAHQLDYVGLLPTAHHPPGQGQAHQPDS